MPTLRALARLAGAASLLVAVAGSACAAKDDGGAVSASSTSTTTTFASSATTTAGSGSSAVDRHAVPLGDGNVASTPKVGGVDACRTTFGGGGAFADGPWIHGKTWDVDAKVHVQGDVAWPQASYRSEVRGSDRVISTMDVPVGHGSGTFPVAASDPAYAYDRNPNRITAKAATITLPAVPAVAASPSCVDLGAVGVLTDGVFLFDALDGEGRDAAAHEVLDACDGHPERTGAYHHHTVPSCVLGQATGASTLVGYAADGFGIFVERTAGGDLLTNADLDECHGHTSEIAWDGRTVSMYHYVATLEYPYTIGCYRGTPTRIAS